MQRWAILLSSLLLAACASAPVSGPTEGLFHDRLFGTPSERINADDVFALTPEMKRYAEAEVSGSLHNKGRRQVLIDALYEKGQLKLDYDSAITRNAAQAFEARSGNCLSLVIMTAAFAKEVGLPVRFQNVYVDETWGRSGDIYLSVGHVNLTLGTSRMDGGFTRSDNDLMTIDFLPASDVRGFHTHAIGEETIIAMYMNNRAVEALARGRFDDAYGWAREAIRQDPRFLSAYNTLGVIYWRHGNASDASEVFSYVLAREPANASAMTNQVAVLNTLGQVAESKALARKLAEIEPNPPFSYYTRGLVAMENGDFKTAKALFAKEVDRAAYYHEFHYWLALASLRLGDLEEARQHLAIALETSTTRGDHDLYAAKLDRIKAYH
jgi:tetratricopeptide (TPR) repeat protein